MSAGRTTLFQNNMDSEVPVNPSLFYHCGCRERMNATSLR